MSMTHFDGVSSVVHPGISHRLVFCVNFATSYCGGGGGGGGTSVRGARRLPPMQSKKSSFSADQR